MKSTLKNNSNHTLKHHLYFKLVEGFSSCLACMALYISEIKKKKKQVKDIDKKTFVQKNIQFFFKIYLQQTSRPR